MNTCRCGNRATILVSIVGLYDRRSVVRPFCEECIDLLGDLLSLFPKVSKTT